MKKILVVISFLFFSNLFSQEIISFEKVRSYTVQQLKAVNPLVQAKYDIDIYNVEYSTKKINNELDTASGTISIPVDTAFKFPIIIFEHGTAGSRDGVPSRDTGDKLLSAILATYGYVCIMPDYIGLGVSKGTHPYLHPQSEAWATVDLLSATHSLADKGMFYVNDQLFITGYSQGGHASMATSRFLNEDKSFEVTASAPMSGPYSVSKEMKKFTMGDTEYSFCGYLGSVLLSAKLSYPELLKDYNIENVFKAEYAELVRKFEAEEINLWSMNTKMINLLKENSGKVLPKRMFLDSIQEQVLNNPNHPINVALSRMDVADWVPEFPLRMIYCTADNQVTYRNAVYTDSLMKANGAENVSAVDVFSAGDHSSCFNFALINMIGFFGDYQNVETVGINDIILENINIWPNPSSGKLNVNIDDFNGEPIRLVIRDLRGELLKEQKLSNSYQEIDLSEMEEGLVFLQIIKGTEIINKKLLIVH